MFCILKDDDGNAWFPTNLNGVSKYDGQNWTWTFRTVPFEAAIWLQNTSAAYVSKNGAIWLGGAGGLSTTTDGETWRSFTSVDYGNANSFLNMNNVTALGEDASNNIWVGGVGYTTNMGLNKYDGTNWTTYKMADGLKSTNIKALFGDNKGNMWVAYQGLNPAVITKIASDGTMTHYDSSPGVPYFSQVEQILETPDGKIWVATYYGIEVFDGTNRTIVNSTNGLLSSQVGQMATDGLGNVWISYTPTLNLGVSMYDGTKWQNFNKHNGLPSDQINSLQVLVTSGGGNGGRTKTTGGTLWLGTPGDGVSSLNIDGFLGLTVTTPPVDPPVTPPSTTTGLADENGGIVLYPIPADESVFLRLNKPSAAETTLTVMDVTGRAWNSQVAKVENTIELSVSALKPGIYFIQWKDDTGVHRERFVKR